MYEKEISTKSNSSCLHHHRVKIHSHFQEIMYLLPTIPLQRTKILLPLMRICFLLIFISVMCRANAQNTDADSIRRLLATPIHDTMRVYMLESLSYSYLSTSPDSAMHYAMEGLKLAEKINFHKGIAICTNALGSVYFSIGDYAKALQMFLSYLRLKESLKNERMAVAYFNLANVYTEQKDYQHALDYVRRALAEDQKFGDTSDLTFDYYSLGNIYTRMNKIDSALTNLDLSYKFASQLSDTNMLGAILNSIGEAHFARKDIIKARTYFEASIPISKAANDNEVLISNYLGIARIYKLSNKIDSAIRSAKVAWSIANEYRFMKPYVEVGAFLTELYSDRRQYDSAFIYQQLSFATRDSLFNVEQVRKVQNMRFEEELRQRALESARVEYRTKIKLFIAISASVLFVAIAFLLWRSSRQKEKANIMLLQAKEKVEDTLQELQQTQSQLIQHEKMASLGELTAGIAHEIQNPLNFVNNFCEVNTELLDELQQELHAGNTSHALDLAQTIRENELKINQHGRRASSIVKGMLEHARTSHGKKEPTDINSLIDEYLKLSYHGLRARDKGFNAKFSTHLDKSIENISVVAPDIGRVLLNLFNNAFHAVREKASKLNDPAYEPGVVVSSEAQDGNVIISVQDNGVGISEATYGKIFQPFFTTKGPGQGTGLGLSISYDIIKAHGGKIEVSSQEGEGTRFDVVLPNGEA
jgi:two-component system NtrC family sensor kinase